MITVDLNCDMGEGGEHDHALLEFVTSVSVACGGHAGDEASMAATVRAALARGVAVGAHPGYPDRTNFGRVQIDMSSEQIESAVFAQVDALTRIAQGTRLSHVKLHGGLYHAAMHDAPTALAVARAVKRIESALMLVAMPGTLAVRLWHEEGFTVMIEAFADRAYETDGSLRSRTLPGALLTDPTAAADQALWHARAQAHSPTSPLTICIHSDTPQAVDVAAAVRSRLEHEGIRVFKPTKR